MYIHLIVVDQLLCARHAPGTESKAGKPLHRCIETSLAVQWLGAGAVTAGAHVQSLVEELRSCKSQAKNKQTNKTPCIIFASWNLQEVKRKCCYIDNHINVYIIYDSQL